MDIKELFRNNVRLTLKEIQKKANLDLETLIANLKLLEEQGIIMEIDNHYQLLPSNYIVKEIKGLKNGYGVFYLNNEKYTIHQLDLNGALNNDLCLFVYDKITHRAKVKKILKRANELLVAEVKDSKLSVYGNNLNYQVNVPSNELKKSVEGNRILVKINNECGNLEGHIIEIIGHKDDPDIDLKQIALSKSFALNFSEKALEELEHIPSEVTEEEIEGRLDLRDKLIYTIDNDHTKDMDDAISIEINEKGNFVLGVHIADVTHYVKYGSALFDEAFSRGNSVYMLNSVIPMLPKYLSNGICSLNPNVDRLTKSCIMEFDHNGNIIDYKIVKSVINSKKKMSYSKVNQVLEKGIVSEDYIPFVDNLKLAEQLSNILNKTSFNRGYIDFQSNDLEVVLDEKNKPLEFIMPKQATAEKLIENFMLAANETVASHYCWYPFIYRIHEMPDNEVLEEIFAFLGKIGCKIPHVKNFSNPKTIQGILKSLINDPNFKIISRFILMGMKKARYSSQNTGHFALAYEKYTHFTSPIRRLCDLMVHYLIDMYDNPDLSIEELNSLENLLLETSIQASYKERKADEAENEANMMKMAEYMENHIGEEFKGKITNITSSKIYVETNNIVGTVKFSDIQGDFFIFDKERFTLTGKSSKRVLKIGDQVILKVLNASKEMRAIDFQICKQSYLPKTKTLSIKNS